jgi:transcriptional regulator of arginine metabolism
MKRNLRDVIRGLIGDGFNGNQSDLAKALKSRGFRVTQSTVSRTMNQMGVIKEVIAGRKIYRLSNEVRKTYRGSLLDLIVKVTNNENMIVIKTRPGSAMFVAGFLDHECKSEILGTVAGDDTIFAVPVKAAYIAEATKKVLNILKSQE